MRFVIEDALLDRVPEYMVMAVVARFAAPVGAPAAAWAADLLAGAVDGLPAVLAAGGEILPLTPEGVRADPRIAAWREAFAELDLNANRFPPSIEALALRVAKGGRPPAINPLVDLANTVALRYLVPLGAHDLGTVQGDLAVRFSRAGDHFAPVGGLIETVPPGEPVYVDDAAVRTRRWVWRQADSGKVTAATRQVFFPIDGFRGYTDTAVLAAAQDLAALLGSLAPESVTLYRLDAECPAVDLLAGPPAAAADIRALPVARDLRAGLARLVSSATDLPGAPGASRQEQPAMTDPPRPPAPPAGPAPVPPPSDAALQEVLERGVKIIEVRADLEKALRSGRQLRVKLGIDPTGPRLHIGRAVTLRKMRQFQRLGHRPVLIVGDLTAQIGDASDKDSERPMLSSEQVRENMRNYEAQIGLVLDLAGVEFQYNSTWLNALNFTDVMNLAKHFTAAQMIVRENFRERWEANTPIGMHELLYPLMQGYDSVAICADVELGGTDQLFNVMAGRKIQEVFGQPPQNILLTGMVMGTDGRKMSTSWGNTIFINDAPVDQYGKLMASTDELIIPYLETCTEVPLAEVRRLEADLATGHAHPKEVKKYLAWQVVNLYHGADAANYAQAEFEKVFEQRGAPTDIPGVSVPPREIRLVDLLLATGQAPSKAQARRVIEQGGVEIDDRKIDDVNANVVPRDGMLIKFGRRSFVRLQVQ